MKNEIEGWWFSTADKKLGYGDDRPVAVGLTHTVTGPPVLCGHGLHLSVLPLDALRYAPGPVIWGVKISGGILFSADKAVGTSRTYLAGGIDITDELRAFARAEALRVAHLWDAPEVVIAYLRTGDESLRELAWAEAVAWEAVAEAAEAAARAAEVAAWEAEVAAGEAWAPWAAWAAADAAAGAAGAARAAEAADAAAWAAAGAAGEAEIARQNLTLADIFKRAIQ